MRAAIGLAVWLLTALATGCASPTRPTSLLVFRTVGDTGTSQTRLDDLTAPDSARPGTPPPANPAAEPPTHLVVIIPGETPDGRLDPWAEALKSAIFARCRRTDPQLRVVVADWSAWSGLGTPDHPADHGSARWPPTRRAVTHLAARAVAELLRDGGHIAPDPATQYVHLIGHARGGTLAGLLARELVVDHLTLLDGFDSLCSHTELITANEPPLRPDLAGWCDNYWSDGRFEGILSPRNRFRSGAPRTGWAAAQANIHFHWARDLATAELYLHSVRDPTVPWGWQWAARPDGTARPAVPDSRPRHRQIMTWPAPRVFVEGTMAQLANVAHEIWWTPPGATSPQRLTSAPSGPAARHVAPGRYIVRAFRTGGPGGRVAVPLTQTVISYPDPNHPRTQTQCVVPSDTFEIGPHDLACDYVFRLAGDTPPATTTWP